MPELIELFFNEVNIHLPILHRPTFEKAIHDGLHLHDSQFGGTVLLVGAVGARYSADPRIFLNSHPTDEHTAGWKWFDQVSVVRTSFVRVATLYELQSFVASVSFYLLQFQYADVTAVGYDVHTVCYSSQSWRLGPSWFCAQISSRCGCTSLQKIRPP